MKRFTSSTAGAERRLEVLRLPGRVPYAEGLEQQETRHRARRAGEVDDALFLLEHAPVLTLGRRADRTHIVAAPDVLAAQGVDVHDTGRGGDVTYHGPGQVVGYPIIDLAPERKDVRRYVYDLEQVMIETCAHFGVHADRVEGLIGCWVGGERKIGAIGVRISRWVTMHGFAFNVTEAVQDAFRLIVPCGISDRGVTTLEAETGRVYAIDEVMDVLEGRFRARFGHRTVTAAEASAADVIAQSRGDPEQP